VVAFEEEDEEEELSEYSESEGSEDFDFDESDEEEDIEDLEFSDEEFAEPAHKAPRRGSTATSVHGSRRAEQRNGNEEAEMPGEKKSVSGRLLQVSGLKRQLAKRGRAHKAICFEEQDEREAALQEE
ncbi:Mak16 protein, partial [Toxoplasma gondii TgCatPRC2]